MSDKEPRKTLNLSEGQLNPLEACFRRILRFLLYQLDDEFRLMPYPESNWPALNCSLISLLKASDDRAFEMINQGMLHSVIKSEAHLNPYTAAAMTTVGMTKNKLFEEVLEAMRDEADGSGPVTFGSKILGMGPLHATLWNLKLLIDSDRVNDHASLVEPGLEHLEKSTEEIFDATPDIAACTMRVAVMLPGCKNSLPLARQCLDNLIERQNENGCWNDDPAGLGIGAVVAGALIDVVPELGDDAAVAASKWIVGAYGLDSDEKETPEWPKAFIECRDKVEQPELWIKSWIDAAIAGARCLSVLRPDHNTPAFLLGMSVPQDNMLVRAQEMIQLAVPYLPPIEKIKQRAALLGQFWGSGAPLEKSVYTMCGADKPPKSRGRIIGAITESLWKHELTGRHLEEGGMAHMPDPWENAALYMTGCRHGIALFESRPGKGGGEGAGSPASPELIFQIGFMRGQGADILILWDKAGGEDAAGKIPGVVAPINGITAYGFDAGEEGIAGIEQAVEKWAASLVKGEEVKKRGSRK